MQTFNFTNKAVVTAAETTNNQTVVQLILLEKAHKSLLLLTMVSGKFDETSPTYWSLLINRDLYEGIKERSEKLKETLVESVYNKLLSDCLLKDSSITTLIEYRLKSVSKRVKELSEVLKKLIPETILDGTRKEYQSWNKVGSNYKVEKVITNLFYEYKALIDETALIIEEGITDEDIKGILSQLTTISRRKETFVKQQLSLNGNTIKAQVAFEVLRVIDTSIVETIRTKNSKVYFKIIKEANYEFFNHDLFRYTEYMERAYKLNIWTSKRDSYRLKDYFTVNSWKSLKKAKNSTSAIKNDHLLGQIDRRSKIAIRKINNMGYKIHSDILNDDILIELAHEDSIYKGLKGSENKQARRDRIAYLIEVYKAKYTVLTQYVLYTDTRLDVVSGRMHGGALQGSKTERSCKTLPAPIKLNKEQFQLLDEYAAAELDLNKASDLAKWMRIIASKAIGSSSEVLEIDATNQVFHLMGSLLQDGKLLAYGGGIYEGETLNDAYTSLGSNLKAKIEPLLKERLGKKAKKVFKRSDYKNLFSRDAMKPLVMPLVYGKGIRSSLYGTIEQQDSTVGFSSAKSSDDIIKIHHQLIALAAKEQLDNDLSSIPLYWGLQAVAWDCISREELETIYTNSIKELFPKLLETMKLLQQSFLSSKGQADAVAFNLFGVSGLIQRKNKLNDKEQFLNKVAVARGEETAYTVERSIMVYIGGKNRNIYYTPYYDRNSNSATNVTPALLTNADGTLVRLVFLTAKTSVEMYQVYDAFYISPVDYTNVVYSYKMGLRSLIKQNPLEKFAMQLGASRYITTAISAMKGEVNPNHIRKMTSLIKY